MADNNTFISGIGNGVLKTALDGVPPWATENTLGRIHGILVKTHKIDQEILKLLTKAVKGIGTKQNTKDIKELSDANKKLADQAKAKLVVDIARSELEKKWTSRADLANGLLTSGTVRLAFATNLAVGSFGLMAAAMVGNVNTYDKLYKAGIGVIDGADYAASGFDALRIMVARTGVSLAELGQIIINSVGANVVGAQTFTKALSMSSGELRRFGFNTKESGELMGAYLDSLVGMGAAQGRSKEVISEGATAFGESMTKLSFRTGTAIKQLQEQTAAIAASTDANVIAAEYGAAAGLKASMFAASFKDPNLGNEFLKMMSSKLPVLNKTFQNLVAGGLGGFGQKLIAFNKSLVGMDPAAAAMAKKKFYGSITNIDQMMQQQQILADAGVQGSAENVQLLTAIKQDNQKLNAISDEQLRRESATMESIKAVQSEWASLMATTGKLFAPMMWVMDTIAFALKGVNMLLSGLLDIPILGTAISVAATALVTFTTAMLVARVAMLTFSGVFPLVRAAVSSLIPMLMRFGAFLMSIPSIGAALGVAFRFITSPLALIGRFIGMAAGALGVLARVIAVAAAPFAPLIAIVASIIGVGILLYTYWDDIVDVAKRLWSGLGNLGEVVKSVGSYLSQGLNKVWDIITLPFVNLWSWIKGSWLGKMFTGDKPADTPVPGGASTNTTLVSGATNVTIDAPAQTDIVSPKGTAIATKANGAVPVDESAVQSSQPSAIGANPITSTDIARGRMDATKQSDGVAEINNALSYQTIQLEKLVEGVNSLVSVSKDILKYTKLQ